MMSSSASSPHRSLLHQLHLVIGGVLCLPFIVLGLTGSILVFDREIDAWLNPLPRAAISSGPSQSVDAIVKAALAANPGYAPFSYIAPGTGESAEVRLRPAGRDRPPGFVQVFVDPAMLTILGGRNMSTAVTRQVQALHATFFARDYGGRAIVGWLGVAMCFLGLSGLILWWPSASRWAAVFRVQKRRAFSLAFLREWHRTIGFWSLSVFMIVSISGAYLGFPQPLSDFIRSVTTARDIRSPGPQLKPIQGVLPALDVTGAIALARTVADGEFRGVTFPPRPDLPLRVSFLREGDEPGTPVPLLTVFIDPWTRSVVEIRDPRTYSVTEKFMVWQRALHAGDGFGWTWRTLVFLSGFLPPFFTISGVAMWWMKTSRAPPHPAGPAAGCRMMISGSKGRPLWKPRSPPPR
jgi:uncharacterized iron-regulated membrane protein